MVQTWRQVAAALTLIQSACASPRDGTVTAGASGEGWACRKLQGGPSPEPGLNADGSWTQRPQGGADAGAVASTLVLWPVLAGACLVSRG